MPNAQWSEEMKSAALMASANLVAAVLSIERPMGTLAEVKQKALSVGLVPTIAATAMQLLDAMDEQIALRRETAG